jgi:alanine racemase
MYTSSDIQRMLGPHLEETTGPATAWITDLVYDSRQIRRPQSSLFVALRGTRSDGHLFIDHAYRQGVRSFLVDRPVEQPAPDVLIIRVDNTQDALQYLAGQHRQLFDYPVIGITGSNGKTIVKEWLGQLLQPDFSTVRSPRSFNSQIGVPLSLWQMRPHHQLGIFEAGISQPGEMERLAALIQPDIGVFTTLGAAHDQGFPSRAHKVAEKVLLFAKAKTIIYPADEPLVQKEIEQLPGRALGWSTTRPEADLYVRSIRPAGSGLQLEADYQGTGHSLTIPFADAASLHNAISCWCVLLFLDIPDAVIAQRMRSLSHLPLRLDLREGVHQSRIINDSYNNDLTGLEHALSFLDQQAGQRPRTLILSDLEQTGLSQSEVNQRILDLIDAHRIHRFIGIGTKLQSLEKALTSNTASAFFPNTLAFLDQLDTDAFRNEIILLKGGRSFAFERISDRLARQVHQTVLEVNLSALAHNLTQYHRLLHPRTRMMVMVKAAAYGSGSREVARLLQHQGVDYLAVAYADEGVELREAGIQVPILVLNPEEAVFETMRRYRLEPEVYSLQQARALHEYLDFCESTMTIHLNLDTGMHRLGFQAPEIEALVAFLAKASRFHIQSVFTHLAASDSPQDDAFTHGQVDQFQQLYEVIVDQIGYRPWQHVLNTSGISRFPQYQFDMVRLGIGIYGIDPGETTPGPLQTVLTFRATVSQLKQIPAGETVGYGRLDPADNPRTLATVTAGYADGLPRAAGRGRYHLYWHGQAAPIIGQVCMDMCMVDVTHLPEVRVGDAMVIFGEKAPVSEMAQLLQTIPYELFAGIATRVKRVYIQE